MPPSLVSSTSSYSLASRLVLLHTYSHSRYRVKLLQKKSKTNISLQFIILHLPPSPFSTFTCSSPSSTFSSYILYTSCTFYTFHPLILSIFSQLSTLHSSTTLHRLSIRIPLHPLYHYTFYTSTLSIPLQLLYLHTLHNSTHLLLYTPKDQIKQTIIFLFSNQ